MKHYMNEGKEILNKHEDLHLTQGRSKKQIENNYRMIGYTMVLGCVFILSMVLIAIFG